MQFLHVTASAFRILGIIYITNISVTASTNPNDRNLSNQILCSPGSVPCTTPAQVQCSLASDSVTFFGELQACNWNRFVIISSDETDRTIQGKARHLFKPRGPSSVLFHEIQNIHLEPQVIQNIIINSFYSHGITNYVWITSKLREVMEAADEAFADKRCGDGAMLSHSFNFVLVIFYPDVSKAELEMANCQFDNVAMVIVNESTQLVDKVYTLMWKEGRRREFQEIGNLDLWLTKREIDVCHMFPNLENGLNGRALVGVAKEWLPEFYTAHSYVTGNLEFSGFNIDVFDVLSTTLNFTYTLVPPAGEQAYLTWDNYRNMVSTCQVDFGINLYANNGLFLTNFTTSFPVMYNDFIGVYMEREKPNSYKLLLVFREDTYFVISSCLLLTVLLYLILEHALSLTDQTLVLPPNNKQFDETKCRLKLVNVKSNSNPKVGLDRKFYRFNKASKINGQKCEPKKINTHKNIVAEDNAKQTERIESPIYLFYVPKNITQINSGKQNQNVKEFQRNSDNGYEHNKQCKRSKLTTTKFNKKQRKRGIYVINSESDVKRFGYRNMRREVIDRKGKYYIDSSGEVTVKCGAHKNKRSNFTVPRGFDNNSSDNLTPPGGLDNNSRDSLPPTGCFDNNSSNNLPTTGGFDNCISDNLPPTGDFDNNSSYNFLTTSGFDNTSRNSLTPTGGSDNNSSDNLPGTGDFDNNSSDILPLTSGFDNNGSYNLTPPGYFDNSRNSLLPTGGFDNNSVNNLPLPGGFDNNSSYNLPTTGGFANNLRDNLTPPGYFDNTRDNLHPTGGFDSNRVNSLTPTGAFDYNSVNSLTTTGAFDNCTSDNLPSPGGFDNCSSIKFPHEAGLKHKSGVNATLFNNHSNNNSIHRLNLKDGDGWEGSNYIPKSDHNHGSSIKDGKFTFSLYSKNRKDSTIFCHPYSKSRINCNLKGGFYDESEVKATAYNQSDFTCVERSIIDNVQVLGTSTIAHEYRNSAGIGELTHKTVHVKDLTAKTTPIKKLTIRTVSVEELTTRIFPTELIDITVPVKELIDTTVLMEELIDTTVPLEEQMDTTVPIEELTVRTILLNKSNISSYNSSLRKNDQVTVSRIKPHWKRPHHRIKSMSKIPLCPRKTNTKEPKSSISNSMKGTKNKIKVGHLLPSSSWEHFVDVFFNFSGSIVGHGTLPETHFWAPRLLLGAWSLTTIILSATFTGNLTSEFVGQSTEIQIKTFDELLGKSQFRWGALKETVVYSLLKAATPGSTLHKLADGIDRFNQTETVLVNSLDELVTKIKSEKFVAIITTEMYNYIEEYMSITGLTFVPDKLLTANQGFLFMRNSSLNSVISTQIIAMRDSGILMKLYKRARMRVNATQFAVEKGSSLYVSAGHMIGLFIVTGCGAGIALGALLVEGVVSKLKLRKMNVKHVLKRWLSM